MNDVRCLAVYIGASKHDCHDLEKNEMPKRHVPTSKFLQSMHLQLSEQKMDAWKHSQYFFRHVDFLQLQPLVWRPGVPSAFWTLRTTTASCSWACTPGGGRAQGGNGGLEGGVGFRACCRV